MSRKSIRCIPTESWQRGRIRPPIELAENTVASPPPGEASGLALFLNDSLATPKSLIWKLDFQQGHNHVPFEFLAIQERPEILERLGYKRSVRALNGSDPRRSHFVGNDLDIAYDRPSMAHRTPYLFAQIPLVFDCGTGQAVSMGNFF